MIDAMITEMQLKQSEWKDTEFNTLYFGGGTPSMLEAQDLEKLMDAVKHNFRNHFQEITMEVNPDDVTGSEILEIWRLAGIHRLSIGVQSFHQRDLVWMNRIHNPDQAKSSILLAQKADFSNISIDLIYGTPGLGDIDWEENLKMMFDMGIPHFSAYALTVEPKTPLDRMIRKGQKEAPSEAHFNRQFDRLMDLAEQAGYQQYEISNFCLPGMESMHNRSYWQRKPYLGIGPSAHEFRENIRSWNVRSNTRYIESLEQGLPFSEQETLSQADRFNETVMTSLRTRHGLELSELEKLSGIKPDKDWMDQAAAFIEEGWMEQDGQRYYLTRKGKHLADYISSELFLVEDQQ